MTIDVKRIIIMAIHEYPLRKNKTTQRKYLPIAAVKYEIVEKCALLFLFESYFA